MHQWYTVLQQDSVTLKETVKGIFLIFFGVLCIIFDLSCPAVSQSCRMTVVEPKERVLIWKSIPRDNRQQTTFTQVSV